jgi:hypothetical protein
LDSLGDRREAWEDSKFINDKKIQEELRGYDTDYFGEPFISREFIDKQENKQPK